jgi:hypothetical protein
MRNQSAYIPMKEIQHNVIDLYWEYERMSSSGQKSLDALAKIVGLLTEKEMEQQSKNSI